MADDVDKPCSSDSYRAAIDAALGGVTEGIACLVRNGVDFRCPVPPGEHLDGMPNQATALLFTATAHALGRPALFALLLRQGAKTDAIDSAGRTSAVVACQNINEYADTLETLLSAGVSPTLPDKAGYGPIHYAAANGHARCVTLLLDAGADPKQSAADGSTPLLLAAGAGAANVYRELFGRFDQSDMGNPFPALDEHWWFRTGGFTFGALCLSQEDGAWENIALGDDTAQVVARVRKHLGPIRGAGTPIVLFRFTGKDVGSCPPNPFLMPGKEMCIDKKRHGRLVYFAPRLFRGLPPNWERPPRYRFVLTMEEGTPEPIRPARAFPMEILRILEFSEWGQRDLPAIVCSVRDNRWIAVT